MFSVLISIYRKEHPDYLRQSLNSIFSQTLLPTEVILVKDGALTPELDSVINEYESLHPCLKIIPLAQNMGLGHALNEGLRYCTYELVARMDTDDISKPDRFEKQVAFMETHPDIDICSAWIEEFENDTTTIFSIRKLPEKHKDIALYAMSRSPINHPVVMFKKSAVLKAGGYQHFPLLEDYYLWIRMLMNGCVFYNIPESLLFFRVSSNMFQRRGGWRYAMNEIRFQRLIHNMGFISSAQLVKNITIRLCVRIMPNRLRAFVYKKVLRK